jgi:argininosuccinate lyase
VALEHARAIGSKALGQTQAIATTVHNTPFGDIVDTEDDLQPLVSSAFHDATRTVKLLAATMRTAEFDAARLRARAAEGWTTLTELADTLARDHRVPFATAHAIAARVAVESERAGGRSLAELLREVSADVLGTPLTYTDTALAEILSPAHFVNVRQTSGGPAPSETARALRVSRDILARDEAWLRREREALASAEFRLAARSMAL